MRHTNPELQLVERIDEMPLTEVHDHISEVPEIEYREVIKQIPNVKVPVLRTAFRAE